VTAPQAPPSPAAALQTAVQAAAIVQASMAPLLAELGAAIQGTQTPAPVAAAAARVLDQQTPIDPPPTAPVLRQAVASSGLFLESRLAQSGEPPASDFKAALIALNQAVSGWKASAAPTPVMTTLQAPTHGMTARPAASTQPPPPETPAPPIAAGAAREPPPPTPSGQPLPASPSAAQPAPSPTPPTAAPPVEAAVPPAAAAAAQPEEAARASQSGVQPAVVDAGLNAPALASPRAAPPASAGPPQPSQAASLPPAAPPSQPAAIAAPVEAPALAQAPAPPFAPMIEAALAQAAATLITEPAVEDPVAPLALLAQLFGAPMEEGTAPPASASPAAASTSQTPPSAQPAPPHAGGPLTAQPPATAQAAPLAADQAAVRLARQVGAALARQTLMQAASTPGSPRGPDERASARWLFELPLATPQGPAVAPFEIDRDGSGGGADGLEATWRARFSLDLDPMGPVHAKVTLTGGQVRVALWAQDPETLARLTAQQHELSNDLLAEDFDAQIAVFPGQPPAAPPPAGRFMDKAV